MGETEDIVDAIIHLETVVSSPARSCMSTAARAPGIDHDRCPGPAGPPHGVPPTSPSICPSLNQREAIMSSTEIDILRSVIDQWKSAVDAHDPHRVASYFTEDAIFQGLHPYSVGPDSVAEYFDSLPIGMTAAYTIHEIRRLADNLILGYLGVDFAFTDQPVLAVYLSVIVRRIGDAWFISHYQVSRLG
jgi:hypothetical protein